MIALVVVLAVLAATGWLGWWGSDAELERERGARQWEHDRRITAEMDLAIAQTRGYLRQQGWDL